MVSSIASINREATSSDKSNADRLGDMLLRRGLISPAQLAFALQKQKVEKGRLGTILVQHGLALEYDVAKTLAEQRKLPFVTAASQTSPDPQVLALFNKELCLSHSFLPLRRTESGLQVLLGNSNPSDIAQLVQRRCDLPCTFLQTEFTELAQQVRQSYYFAQNPIESLMSREVKFLADDVDNVVTPERLLDLLLHLAIRERASDIHLAPSAQSWHVLFRVDGILRPIVAMPPEIGRLLTYLKLVAEMDISEQRRPQDGSFHVTILDMPYTVRISTLISENGERMVLRLLPERGELSGLLQLGFRHQDVAVLARVFERPAGLVLVTGPTGSGKSTTLHAALRMQSLIERNVLTVEDPVEYRVPGACQTEVNRRAGYEFSTALRNFLRHDPDVMLIGEIRDSETAQAAIESAATGHLVLSTLHVANVFGVIPRLRPFGLRAQEIADNLVAIISQRLVRKNCSHCSKPEIFGATVKHWLGAHVQGDGSRGAGCPACRGSGYLGRTPIYEILQINDALVTAIVDDHGREALHRTAQDAGFTPMIEMAKAMVASGQTTIDEVVRVLGDGPQGMHP